MCGVDFELVSSAIGVPGMKPVNPEATHVQVYVPPVTTYLVHEYYRRKLMENLMSPLEWIPPRSPDTRSRFRKLIDRVRYRTVGRFRDWLHRDCGDY